MSEHGLAMERKLFRVSLNSRFRRSAGTSACLAKLIVEIALLTILFAAWGLPARNLSVPDQLSAFDEFSLACRAGDLMALKKLIATEYYRYYGPLDYRPWERERLALAAQSGHREVCEFLIAHGADPNLRTMGGWYPIFYTVYNGDLDLTRSLLDHGAHVYGAGDPDDFTALNLAAIKGDADIAALLLDHDANVKAQLSNSGETPLHFAAENGRLAVVELLLKRGAGINAKTKFNYTPLHLAAANGQVSVCNLLLNRGAETDIFSEAALGREDRVRKLLDRQPELLQARIAHEEDQSEFPTPAHFAAAAGKLNILILLAQRGVDLCPAFDEAGTPLFYAAEKGRYQVVKYLLDHKADPNSMLQNNFTPPLVAAVEGGHRKTAQLLLLRGAEANAHTNMNPTPFQIAARKADREMCLLLIAHGANINSGGLYDRTPLHEAPNAEIARLLIDHGAKVNAREHFRDCTPLWFAASGGRTDVAKVLLARGADPNHPCEGMTPLQIAAEGGHEDICALLLSRGVDVNQSNHEKGWPPTGYTALHLAARRGQREIVFFLISKGANVNARSSTGETPLAAALSNYSYFCAGTIQAHGGIK